MIRKNNKKRGIFLPENDTAIKRYIKIYLNRKYDSSVNPKDLEMQKRFIVAMLRHRGFNSACFNDLFLRQILNGEILFPLEKNKYSNKTCSKIQTKNPKNDTEHKNIRKLKYQKLASLYFEYLKRIGNYPELFAAFQDYFDSYFDVYGEHLTEQMVLSLTKSVIEPKEELL